MGISCASLRRYDSGLMYIGTRNRIAGATDNDAGNYVMGIYFHPSEFTQPREIRKAMTNGKFVGGRKDVLNSWRTYKVNFNQYLCAGSLHQCMRLCVLANIIRFALFLS